MTGYAERLTRAPRVSLQGLSTRFTSVIQDLTGVIDEFGDSRLHPSSGGVSDYRSASRPRAVHRSREKPLRSGPSCPAIGTGSSSMVSPVSPRDTPLLLSNPRSPRSALLLRHFPAYPKCYPDRAPAGHPDYCPGQPGVSCSDIRGGKHLELVKV